ncbi:hypothetical protein [Micromonospora sp. NPDC002575]|uniref:hypothetical protein n=1 Tax=Micromonospora sp. NPDC002575 TaxID=3364222 RepID=UPI0036CA52CB
MTFYMQVRRLVATMATLTAVLAAIGCGPGDSGQDSASTTEMSCGRSGASPVGPQGEGNALAAAVGWISREPVRVTTDSAQATGQGVMDARRRTATMSYTLRKNDRMILVTLEEDDVYFAMLNVPGISLREIVGQMVRDARRRGAPELRDLATRIGVDPLDPGPHGIQLTVISPSL